MFENVEGRTVQVMAVVVFICCAKQISIFGRWAEDKSNLISNLESFFFSHLASTSTLLTLL